MAVEARHLNLFPPQLLANREMMNPIEGNGNMFQTQMGYGVAPLSDATEGLLPLYNSLVGTTANHNSSIHQKAAAAAAAAAGMKTESGLTYNNNLPLQRKRSRDSINPILSFPSNNNNNNNNNNNKTCSAPFSFLGHDFLFHMEQQQLDIDHLISQHMEKVKMEIEEKRKRQTRKIMEAIEGGVMKRLRAKEEEIEKIWKLNWALEERVKSLSVENQIWRDLAQTNEAKANVLRTNLEQVLAAAAQVKDERTGRGVGFDETAAVVGDEEIDDAQSCCGSSGEVERRTLADEGVDKKDSNKNNNDNNGEGENNSNRLCRNCRQVESCVLLLPCRHLCLCTACGSTLHICPLCKSTKNASIHVKMS